MAAVLVKRLVSYWLLIIEPWIISYILQTSRLFILNNFVQLLRISNFLQRLTCSYPRLLFLKTMLSYLKMVKN